MSGPGSKVPAVTFEVSVDGGATWKASALDLSVARRSPTPSIRVTCAPDLAIEAGPLAPEALPPPGRFASAFDPEWRGVVRRERAEQRIKAAVFEGYDITGGEPTVAREEEPGLVVVRTESGRFLMAMPTSAFERLRSMGPP